MQNCADVFTCHGQAPCVLCFPFTMRPVVAVREDHNCLGCRERLTLAPHSENKNNNVTQEAME